MNIGIVGLGMIGGSIAKSLKRCKNKYTIIAYDTDGETLKRAVTEKVIDGTAADFSSFSECEVVFVAVPCEKTIETVQRLSAETDALITDVASVKDKICRELSSHRFIGGHPMAGVENGGYAACRAHMFENAYYVLIGDKKSEDYRLVEKLVIDMKAIPYPMDSNQHDRTVAKISHLPHMVAYSLVNSALSTGDCKTLAAGGFKDITRVASSSSKLWTQIAFLNRDNIIDAIDSFVDRLTVLKAMLIGENRNQLSIFMDNAKMLRDGLDSQGVGAISRAFELTIDIEDKVGQIKRVTEALSKNKISIANISVQNSREGQIGVLKVVFFDRISRENAERVLKSEGIICLGI